MGERTTDIAKQEVGTKATIVIEARDGEFQLGLNFHGQKMSEDPTVIQVLAMVGCEAIREAIRETFNVTDEQLVGRPDPDRTN